MCFVAIKIVKLTHAIAWILEREKIRAGGRTTFETGVAVPSVVLPPTSRSCASDVLGHGGRNHGLWPPGASHKASAALTIAMDVLLFLASTASRMEGGRRIKNIAKKNVVWADTLRKMLLELPHEGAGLEALHLHGESEQLKIGLPFALSKLPKQNFFQEIKRLI